MDGRAGRLGNRRRATPARLIPGLGLASRQRMTSSPSPEEARTDVSVEHARVRAHASCDLVARTEELVRALSSDLEEERDALAASQQAEESTVVIDQESA
jgi:hypothetical protein